MESKLKKLRDVYKINRTKTFNHCFLPDNVSLIQHNTDSGRYYTLPDDETKFYSVTTVLHHMTEDIINDWKKAVGDEYAKRESNIASSLGTMLHSMCEHYLLNNDVNLILKNNMHMYDRFKKFIPLLDRIDNVYALEKRMYSKALGLAGTVDCIAEFDGELAIIDFKTSKKLKYDDQIPHYFAQGTAYAAMALERYGISIKKVVILTSIENDEPSVYVKSCKEYIPVLKKAIKTFRSTL